MPGLGDFCLSCENSWGVHQGYNCPLPDGGWRDDGGWRRRVPGGTPTVATPAVRPNSKFTTALEEGIFILAGKLYKETGKHLLRWVQIDPEELVKHGYPREGCEIQTAVGPVKVIGSLPERVVYQQLPF